MRVVLKTGRVIVALKIERNCNTLKIYNIDGGVLEIHVSNIASIELLALEVVQ